MNAQLQGLQWSQALATGIPEVDEQHRELLDIFNRAALAQAQGTGSQQARRLLESLVEYTRYHFREEARLMQRWSIAESHRAMHLRAHRSFTRFLHRAQALAERQPADVTVDVLAFLAQWLLHHIAGVDARMAREVGAAQGTALPRESGAGNDAQLEQLVEAVSQLTDTLGQRTFDLLAQRQRLLDLQGLYRALMRSGEVLIQSRSEHEMLASLCAKLTQETPFHVAWVGRPGASQLFEVLAIAGEGAAQVRQTLPRLCDEQAALVVVKAWNSRQPVVCNDTLADASLQPWHEGFRSNRWLAILAVPIVREHSVWAVLTFVAARRQVFDERTVEVCGRIAALLGFGLDEFDLKGRIQTLQAQEARMARTDSLTQLPNRFAFEEYLPAAIQRSQRRGRALAVGMIDLDDFKPVNDRFGHEAGDELLRAVAARLRERLRGADFLARLGGDEFAVVLEDLDAGQVLQQLGAAFRRLHQAVDQPFALGGEASARIDMTLGVAIYPSDGVDADALLRKADVTMYQAKQHKDQRPQWWRMSSAPVEEPHAEAAPDPFGLESRELLEGLWDSLDSVAERFALRFRGHLQASPEMASILASLDERQLRELACTEAAQLRFLLDPRTTAQAAQSDCARLGTVHALVGVSGAWMTQALGLLREVLHEHLDAAVVTARTRYRTLRAVESRLQLVLQAMLQAMRGVADSYQAYLTQPFAEKLLSGDAIQAELDSLAALPGVRAAVLFRPDAGSRFLIEQASGAIARELIEAFAARELHPMVDPGHARGQGLVAMTWMSEQAQHSTAYALDPRTRPWQHLMADFQVCSALAVPVHRDDEIHAVLMVFGGYPHQFASSWMQLWRTSLQNRWDQMLRSMTAQAPVIGVEHKLRVRELLHAGALRMFVQPIVDLRSGELRKVEALARLLRGDGTYLQPAEFLPALGNTDLHLLLRQGLAQALAQLRPWQRDGLDIGVTVNLAPASLIHPDCPLWIGAALRDTGVAPGHLTLELLECQPLQTALADAAIARLSALGVRIAMDDLGSGFSSLQRLAELPFNVIKIDQGIVKELSANPLKALSLIRSTVQIGQDFEREVVAEGLEDAGLIEAVCLLGCQLGQGYGLARPMPAEALSAWVGGERFRGCDGAELHSWVGALAYQWLLLHDNMHLRHPGMLERCPMTRFLRERRVGEAEVLDWHERIHHSPYEHVRLQAMRQLTHWLAERVREDYQRAPGASRPAAAG